MILEKMIEKTQKLCMKIKIIDQFLQNFASCQNWFPDTKTIKEFLQLLKTIFFEICVIFVIAAGI